LVTKLVFPKFDANIVDGMIGRWHKREGERVEAGEPLVEIITDKAKFDYESPASGILRKVVAAEKSTVPVGYVIAIFADAEEPLPDVSAENEAALVRYREALAVAGRNKGRAATVAPPSGERIRATPAARRLAREAGVPLADIALPPGKNVMGEEDVKAYLARNSAQKRGERK
jgi:pyruvate dehydrogenase E2 component (dihydrolipoamide acetyltransferase)